jgi:hypothetical protein
MMTPPEIVHLVCDAFSADVESQPVITLRGGDCLDDYRDPPPFDPDLDAASDEYLESFHWGVGYLDAASWRHYLPALTDYTVRHFNKGTLVGEALVWSLCAPDRNPPRLATLTQPQEEVVTRLLEFLAFTDGSGHQDSACRAIDEWWSAYALYRPGRGRNA